MTTNPLTEIEDIYGHLSSIEDCLGHDATQCELEARNIQSAAERLVKYFREKDA